MLYLGILRWYALETFTSFSLCQNKLTDNVIFQILMKSAINNFVLWNTHFLHEKNDNVINQLLFSRDFFGVSFSFIPCVEFGLPSYLRYIEKENLRTVNFQSYLIRLTNQDWKIFNELIKRGRNWRMFISWYCILLTVFRWNTNTMSRNCRFI